MIDGVDRHGVRLTSSLVDQPLSGLDDFGCRWSTSTLDGWGSPASTLSPVQKTQDHGAWLSPRFLTPRSISIGGLVRGPDRGTVLDALDRLNAAVSLDAATLTVTESADRPRTATVFRQDEVIQTWITDTLVQWSAQVVAVDPRKYGELETFTVGLPATSGGVTWPVSWPIEWNATATSGSVHIYNPGNIITPIKMRVAGPCPAPTIRHEGSGLELVLGSSYSIPAGSFLQIDPAAKTVLEGGSASRNQWITSRGWFGLDPGPNDITFGADVYDPAALLTVTFAPAYL